MRKQIATLLGLTLFFATLMWVKGDLNLNLFSRAYAVGDLTVNWGVPEGDPIFVVNNSAPGDSEDRTVSVTNGAATSRPVGIKGIEVSDTDGLSDVLDFVIKKDGSDIYGGLSGTGPKTISQFYDDTTNNEFVPLSTLAPGEVEQYTFIVTFQQGAGNEYQDQEIIFDLKIGIAIDLPDECEELEIDADLPIFGTDGNDTINGTKGNDIIVALEGNDKVFGHGGDDCIIGGTGNDELDGGNGNDFVLGNENTDKVRGGNGKDLVIGGSGNDTMDGGNNEDTLFGDEGNDKIEGGNQDDKIEGGSGNDEIDGGNGEDTIDGNEGDDIIKGRNGKDTINGGDNNDTLDGGNANDTLTGDSGTDSAQGGTGIDTCTAETVATCEL